MSIGELVAKYPQWADIAIGILASQALYKAVGNDYYRAICFMISIRISIHMLKKYYEGTFFSWD